MYSDNIWTFSDPIVSKGDDVFIVDIEGKKTEYIFSEGEYGKRIDALNLEVNDKYTLGVYHISGAEEDGTGYYVTPEATALWRQPKIGGQVSHRGIRIHYVSSDPRNWTEGCFVISSKYTIV